MKRDSSKSTAKAVREMGQYATQRQKVESQQAERRKELAREIAHHQARIDWHRERLKDLKEQLRFI